MGFNTTIILMNDALSSIENDNNLGKKLASAVRKIWESKPVDISCGMHCNAITVLESHHSSDYVPVMVGRNWGFPISRFDAAVSDEAHNAEIALLMDLADKHGYVLHRKPKRKGG